eukprot:767436-Hanusia_phi.AAC.3
MGNRMPHLSGGMRARDEELTLVDGFGDAQISLVLNKGGASGQGMQRMHMEFENRSRTYEMLLSRMLEYVVILDRSMTRGDCSWLCHRRKKNEVD